MKTIFIGADHRGFELKNEIVKSLMDKKYSVVDMGADQENKTDDFVDFATLVGGKVSTTPDAFGVLLCGSGVGMCIAANKIPSIRCAVGHSLEEIRLARQDDNINILSLSADTLSKEDAISFVEEFLETDFVPQERYLRRIAKIESLEHHA
ncbi:MAG: RpiB/LacA/LacB family sugar-phosphate isomerase [Candidatus Levybacteria bacterium]|nr:RpiB/LacA/LacB family sugar-phosphate isomerase [Candidatus Levybacteria bacterium]